jgi:hypothetical protein
VTTFRIVLKEALPAFRPFEVLEGQVEWEGSDLPEPADLRLCWSLSGEEPEVSRAEGLDLQVAQGSHPFQWKLPDQPCSFEGKLFSIQWWIEVTRHDEPLARVAVILSPTGQVLRPRD